jgi:general secretion pathway protein K
VFTQLVSSGRSETELAANLREAAEVQAVADGALYQAIFHLLDPSPARWATNAATHEVRLADATAAVSIIDLAGRVNPNTASQQLLSALMTELGEPRTAADAIAEAIVDWRAPEGQGRFGAASYAAAGLSYRPAASGFQSLDELDLVLGMTPSLLALLGPHLSLTNPDNPDPRHADPVVLRAMKDIGIEDEPSRRSGGIRNVMITATVIDRSGARFVRQATVRLGAAAPYEILSWNTPAWS